MCIRHHTFYSYVLLYVEWRYLMENLFSLDNLADALAAFNSIDEEKTERILNSNMSEEMLASQKRYEEYIIKNTEN